MERFGANTHPAKNFQVKILQGIFLEGSAGVVPLFCIFGKEWIVCRKW
nr:MAG TPA: hypothetical protein [Caudoviricetes sp.]